jgi:hypothetical protein
MNIRSADSPHALGLEQTRWRARRDSQAGRGDGRGVSSISFGECNIYMTYALAK